MNFNFYFFIYIIKMTITDEISKNLIECSLLTLDPYWKQVFEECSNGKFPKGSNIDQTTNTVFIKNKPSKNYKLTFDPHQDFVNMKELFHQETGLKSNRDRQKTREKIETICEDLKDQYTCDWKDIRGKKIKDPIITRYILDLKEKYGLSNKEVKQATQTLKLGFLFNLITTDKVIYENHQIIDITALHFNEKTRLFKLVDKASTPKRDYKPKVITFSSLWEKYLKSPKNRYL